MTMTIIAFGDLQMKIENDGYGDFFTVRDNYGRQFWSVNPYEARAAFISALEGRIDKSLRNWCRTHGRNEFTGGIINGICESDENKKENLQKL